MWHLERFYVSLIVESIQIYLCRPMFQQKIWIVILWVERDHRWATEDFSRKASFSASKSTMAINKIEDAVNDKKGCEGMTEIVSKKQERLLLLIYQQKWNAPLRKKRIFGCLKIVTIVIRSTSVLAKVEIPWLGWAHSTSCHFFAHVHLFDNVSSMLINNFLMWKYSVITMTCQNLWALRRQKMSWTKHYLLFKTYLLKKQNVRLLKRLE